MYYTIYQEIALGVGLSSPTRCPAKKRREMNIEKAIEELNTINHDGFVITRYTEYEALKLGIEALKYAQRDRRGLSDVEIELLPGETEE